MSETPGENPRLEQIRAELERVVNLDLIAEILEKEAEAKGINDPVVCSHRRGGLPFEVIERPEGGRGIQGPWWPIVGPGIGRKD